jgi:hypothetical protein
VFLNEHPLGASFNTFFSDLKPGAVELVPIRDGTIKSLDDYAEHLPGLPSTQWVTEVSRHGGRPVIAFLEVPIWLQQPGHADANFRPPKDLGG